MFILRHIQIYLINVHHGSAVCCSLMTRFPTVLYANLTFAANCHHSSLWADDRSFAKYEGVYLILITPELEQSAKR